MKPVQFTSPLLKTIKKTPGPGTGTARGLILAVKNATGSVSPGWAAAATCTGCASVAMCPGWGCAHRNAVQRIGLLRRFPNCLYSTTMKDP